ncbi:HNH endonuclease [Pseudorhizobium sp. NPDC055634]
MGRLKTLQPRIGTLAPRIGRAPGDEKARLRERDTNVPWHGWYYTERWRKLRREVWRRDSYTCRMSGVLCIGKYPDWNSPVADHIIKHNGDERFFWDINNVQTLAKIIHDRVKQQIENGWQGDVDALIAKVLADQGSIARR